MIRFYTVQELGRIIREERRRKGFTQTELAQYCNVGINYISNLEHGKETTELGKSLLVLHMLGIDLFAQPRGEK